MNNQTNYPPQQSDTTSGVNTVLLVVVILILAGFGYWWFVGRAAAPEDTGDTDEPGINVDVNFPDSNDDTDAGGNPGPTY